MKSHLRVALVHDYLVTFGGAERVLLALHDIWPQAPVYVSLVSRQGLGRHWRQFRKWDLRVSWFQKVPFSRRLISPLRFLLPYIWESFDLSDYDLVVSSSSWAMSKAVITGPGTKHFCYCHTPPRFLYHYPAARPWQKYRIISMYANMINNRLRLYDYATSQRVDYFLANSHEVAGRIAKFWRRKSEVVYPPIDVPRKLPKVSKKDFYLYVSRLVSYKHPLLAIRVCKQLKKKLVVVGSGPLAKDVALAAQNSSFIDYRGHVDDRQLKKLYCQAKAVIFPSESEDLGMRPLEAAAWGTPTIGYYSGGIKETIIPGKTGMFFKRMTSSALAAAIKEFEKKAWSSRACRDWARHFRTSEFQTRLVKFIETRLDA